MWPQKIRLVIRPVSVLLSVVILWNRLIEKLTVSHSDGQGILCLLRNLNAHDHVHNFLTLIT
jgi:hypothetical protein